MQGPGFIISRKIPNPGSVIAGAIPRSHSSLGQFQLENFQAGSKNTRGYKIAGPGNTALCPSLFQSAKMAVIGAWLTLKLIMRGRLEIIILAPLCSMESYIFSEENLSQALPEQFPTWTWIRSLIKMRFRSKKQLERPLMSFQ